MREAVKLRQQLETLAGQTVKLAADGDEGAKTVVDQMKQQGVTLNPQRKVTDRRIPLTRGSWIGEYPLVFSSRYCGRDRPIVRTAHEPASPPPRYLAHLLEMLRT